MKFLIAIILILLILFFQIGLSPYLGIFGAHPNLILVSLLSLTILIGIRRSLIWIILVGVFLDFYTLNNFLGVSAASLIASACTIFFLSQNLFKKTNFVSIIILFLAAIAVYYLFLFGFNTAFGSRPEFKLITLLFNVFYNIIFAIPVFYLVKTYVNKFIKV